MFYSTIRKLLFSLDPELAHHLAMSGIDFLHRAGLMGLLPSLLAKSPAPAPVQVMGLNFPNPVGLAAGLDKNAEHIDALAALGFGFIEVGTVTPRAQPGNPKPRLFRIPEKQALINRMGFNNAGVEALLTQLAQSKFAQHGGILGINIGKNFDTPLDRAADDYLLCLKRVYTAASYVAINISSPNTQNLRELQKDAALDALLGSLKLEQNKLAEQHGNYVPLALKIAPDLSAEQISSIAALLRAHRIDAVIATNTSLAREGVADLPNGQQSGGLSGLPVAEPSTAVVKQLAQALAGEVPIIGVGGIMSGADAANKLAAGASLVQLYTGFIYRGPALISDAVSEILRAQQQHR